MSSLKSARLQYFALRCYALRDSIRFYSTLSMDVSHSLEMEKHSYTYLSIVPARPHFSAGQTMYLRLDYDTGQDIHPKKAVETPIELVFLVRNTFSVINALANEKFKPFIETQSFQGCKITVFKDPSRYTVKLIERPTLRRAGDSATPAPPEIQWRARLLYVCMATRDLSHRVDWYHRVFTSDLTGVSGSLKKVAMKRAVATALGEVPSSNASPHSDAAGKNTTSRSGNNSPGSEAAGSPSSSSVGEDEKEKAMATLTRMTQKCPTSEAIARATARILEDPSATAENYYKGLLEEERMTTLASVSNRTGFRMVDRESFFSSATYAWMGSKNRSETTTLCIIESLGDEDTDEEHIACATHLSLGFSTADPKAIRSGLPAKLMSGLVSDAWVPGIGAALSFRDPKGLSISVTKPVTEHSWISE